MESEKNKNSDKIIMLIIIFIIIKLKVAVYKQSLLRAFLYESNSFPLKFNFEMEMKVLASTTDIPL